LSSRATRVLRERPLPSDSPTHHLARLTHPPLARPLPASPYACPGSGPSVSISPSLCRSVVRSFARSHSLSLSLSLSLCPRLISRGGPLRHCLLRHWRRGISLTRPPPRVGALQGPMYRPAGESYAGTSLIRNCVRLGPYSRPMPRALRWS